MFSIKELEQKKEDIKELNDLPIEDFVGWDGWERMINSHIEALQKIGELEKLFKDQVQNNYCIICGDNATEARQGIYYCDYCCN